MTNAAILSCYRQQALELDEIVNGEHWTSIGGLYRVIVEDVAGIAGHEAMYGFQWLYATLSGDSTLMALLTGGVWRALVDPAAVAPSPPWAIISSQAGSDVVTMNAFRLFADLVFQVRVFGPATMTATLVSAAARIDTLIGGPTSGTV